jgi:tetratricopeptide (TPR) repeat protein
MKPFWATFYSYKGGVGRSLSLANIAALLVQKGRRVVLIDFDLEAPGLDSFEEFKSVACKAGVVEYVAEFEKNKIAPTISDYVHACELPGNLRGKLWIMPAGKKDCAYNSARATLDWIRLYDSGMGEPFVENWKAAIAKKYKPDYVLIDSRTGLTDVGGICTLHLPDLVVMLFGLNEQNVNGIAAVAKTIAESNFKKVPQLHYVASPVPNLPRDKDSALTKRLAAAATCLGIKIDSTIRYQANAALSEKLFVLEDQQSPQSIVSDYEDLLKKLISYNRNGIDFLTWQVNEAIEETDPERAERLYVILKEEFPDHAESRMCQARLKLMLGTLDEAIQLANDALRLDPGYRFPFYWLLQQYKKKQKYDLALGICNFVLENSGHLPPSAVADIHESRGECGMAASDYSAAIESFAFSLERETSVEKIPEKILVYAFNLAEASRRKHPDVKNGAWHDVIKFFDSSGEVNASPLSFQANRWQAIHIAFALTGNLARARESLVKARHAAELLGSAEDLFTVKTYTMVSVKEWLAVNDEMLAALDRGELWDGMKLPATGTT